MNSDSINAILKTQKQVKDNKHQPDNVSLLDLVPKAREAGLQEARDNNECGTFLNLVAPSVIRAYGNQKQLIEDTLNVLLSSIRHDTQECQDIDETKMAFTPKTCPEVVKAQEKLQKAQTNLKFFQETHVIKREADSLQNPTDFIYLLGTFAMIETVIGAIFYNSQRGFATAFSLAFGFAIAIMALAVLAGHWLKYKNYRESGKPLYRLPQAILRISGCIGLYLLMFIVITIQCFFRANIENEAYGLGMLVKDLHQLNFKLWDVSTVVMFFISSVLANYCLYKSYRFNDTYPGYGDEFQKYLTAKAELVKAQNALQEYNRKQLEQREIYLRSLRARLQNADRMVSSYVRRAERSFETFILEMERINREYRSVVDAYLSAYRAVAGNHAKFAELPISTPQLSDTYEIEIQEAVATFAKAAKSLEARLDEKRRETNEVLSPAA